MLENRDKLKQKKQKKQKKMYKDIYFDNSSHLLIFQSDSYIFNEISPIYYQYDYVGAPWTKVQIGNGCGNGGISLRLIDAMKKVTNNEGVNYNEDIYFSKQQCMHQ